ncbi:hypothetical protein [Clostridium perfringens]|jgi:hypothetical protein|uniref:Uncharacterized protein n=1 Tax=Clostridium perfringens TaxID=1502 RepID=A0AAW4J6A8_CLOPF|nr:hypothetical protein [Clostridium perfringens]MBO3356112.1 hypothetical protein [Clostridium perfringens]MBO3359547.1 hypothetical protein [Clostridium perfringens]
MWAEFCDIYSEDNNEEVIEVNGVKFYYNPKELNIDKYIEILRKFPEDEKVYSVYIDETQGLVIY